MKYTEHLGDAATRSASPSAAGETRTGEPSSSASSPSHGTTEHLGDPERYQIINEHGRGGLGRVSRAHDRNLGRDVAVKELISRGAVNEVRFLREALITARLEHPGIVPIYEAGRRPDGTPFYAMKLVAGRPLRQLIAERTTVDERITLLHHVIAVADAMAYAHGRKIIHRDLKPGNVIVGDFGETIVIDWGLAKDLSVTEEPIVADGPSGPTSNDLTSTGSVLGTPAYMAPEQERGEPVDQRADVFAIGAMLWELCSTHKVPPRDPQQRHRMLRRAGIDPDLVAILDKAIDADPRRRYRDAGALAADLKAFKSGARITARSYSLLALLRHWILRHQLLAIAAVAVLVLVAVWARAALHSRTAELEAEMAQQKLQAAQRVAEVSVTVAAVEQGRQALLHGETADAEAALTQAYQRGDHSFGVAFMLARALQPRRAELAKLASSSAGRMWSARFSPDGRQIVTTDEQNAQLWDAATYQLRFTLAHGAAVADAVYSADGATLVTAGTGVVRIWDARNGTLVRELTSPGATLLYDIVALSPDGTRIAAIDAHGASAQAWDARSGALLAALPNDTDAFPSLAFSADGRWLATSGGDVVHLIDTTTWTVARTLPIHHVRCLSFDPTGPRLATGATDGSAVIWDIASGTRIRVLRELGEGIERLAYSANGELIVTAAHDGAEQVWDAKSGGLRSQLNPRHARITSIELDRTSTLVVAASVDGAVVVSDVAQGMPVAVLEGPNKVIAGAHFDPSARRVIGASRDGTARVWDATAPYRRWSAPPPRDGCGLLSLEPDRRFVAITCGGAATRVWDTAHDRLLAELPAATQLESPVTWSYPAVTANGDRVAIARGNDVVIYDLPGGAPRRTISHHAAISAVVFAPSGDELVTGSIDGDLRVTRDRDAPIALPKLSGAIDAAAILADGRLVVTAGNRLQVFAADRTTKLADLALASRVGLLRVPSQGTSRLVTIPRFMGGSSEPTVLWDFEHYRAIAELDGRAGAGYSARFVAGDQAILTTGVEDAVQLWDATTGQLRQTFRASSRFYVDAALSPDGAMVVGAAADGLLRFWDTTNQRPLWAMQAHRSHVAGIHFEGDDLVTHGSGGDMARWHLPRPDEVIGIARAPATTEATK